MKKKIIVILTVVLAAAALTVGVFASTGAVQVTLNYRDIRITLNGQEIQPKDAGGNPVEPFIIDGTTWLPVRAVSEALGLDVQWDEETSTVQLTEIPSEEPANDLAASEIPQSPNDTPAPPSADTETSAPPAALPPTEPDQSTAAGFNDGSAAESDSESVAETDNGSTTESSDSNPTDPDQSSAAEPDNGSAESAGNTGGDQGSADSFDTYSNSEQQQTEARYVLDLYAMKVHHPKCSAVPQISPENFATSNAGLAALQNQGFTLCGICRGEEPNS